MIDVRVSRSAEDDLRSLEIYNAVAPLDAFAFEDAQAFKASLVAADEFVASLDGSDVGSAFAESGPIGPTSSSGSSPCSQDTARTVSAQLSTLPRRRGWPSIAWMRSRRSSTKTIPPASAFAERRGFTEIGRNGRMTLDLRTIDPPEVSPPDGIEIVTWAERPELARGMYEVAREAYPDIPGEEDDLVEPFEDWFEHDMSGPGDRPEATFVAVAGDVAGSPAR